MMKKGLFKSGGVSILLAMPLLVTSLGNEAYASVPPGFTSDPTNSAATSQQRFRDDLERERLKQELNQYEAPPLDEELIDDGGAEDALEKDSEPVVKEPTGPSFEISTIKVEPETVLLDPVELAQVVKGYEGKEVTFSDLQALVADINRLYLKSKHVNARAYLPPQDIKGGELKINLVEGKLGLLTYEGNDSTYQGFLDMQWDAEPGEVMDLAELEFDIEWLNRTAGGIQASARLEPGAGFGETDLHIQVREPPRFGVRLIGDNWGTESSGQERGSLLLTSSSLFGIRDQFAANLTLTENENTGWGSYSIPVTPWNGRLGATYSRSRVDITNQNFADISIVGRSIDRNMTFDQPFFLKSGWLLTANSSIGDVRSRTYIDGVRAVSTDLYETTLGMTAEYIGPSSYFTTRVKRARLDEKDQSERDRAKVWSGNFALMYRLNPDWFFVSTGGWQYTDDVFVPSGRLFQIGGATTVRGYLSGALSGNKGYYGQLEAHRNLPYGFDVFLFGDTGFADPFAEISKSYGYISSAGVGTNWSKGPVSASLVYGHAMNHDRYVDQKSGEVHAQIMLDVLKGWEQVFK